MFVTPIISYYTALNYPNVPVLSNFHIILGNISPNQWHNSTLIFSMPANILLFYYSISRFDSNKYYDFIIMGCLVVLSLLCKPSYVLAFLPVLCGSIFVNNIKLGHYWSAFTKQIPIAIIALPIMAYQYHVTFTSAPAMQKTIIAPFLVMNAYSPHIGI